MKAAVLVPGLMGCRLAKPGTSGQPGEEVWPPTVAEFVIGYRRLDDLLRDDLIATGILERVSFKGIYSSLEAVITDSGFILDGTEKFYAPFVYDWRRDIFATADRLVDHLDTLARDGAEEISIIAHSMGGLVARLALESPRAAGRIGVARTTLLVTVGTPHLGAPLALARTLGLDGGLGISASGFKRISSDARYPSGYQLLPAPDDMACWDQARSDIRPIDIYERGAAKRLGLVPELVEGAQQVHKALREGTPRPGVRYVNSAGTGHKTVTRINAWLGDAATVAEDRFHLTRTREAGDGTVPTTSASRHGQRQILVGEHASFFGNSGFRQLCLRLLGASVTAVLESEKSPDVVEGALSVESLAFPTERPIGVALAFSHAATGEPAQLASSIKGRLILERLQMDGATINAVAGEIPVAYSGPALDRLSFDLAPPGQAGLYSLRFEGGPPHVRPTTFAVSAG